MIKKILLLIVAGLAVVTTVVYAAPSVNIFRNIHPETDSTYYNGTTTAAWLGVVSDEFCLTGDSCINQWPAGSGGGASTTIAGLSPSNGVYIFATGTAQGIGLTISTTSPRTITFTPTVSSGYVIPLSASTTEWATAYGWGNHAGLYPTFAYASSTFPSFAYATNTFATIANYPTYTYASSTFPSFTYASSSYFTLFNVVAGSNITVTTSTALKTIAVSSTPTFTSVTTTNASTTSISVTNLHLAGDSGLLSQNCLGTDAAGKVKAGTCSTSGNAAWTIGSGVIYNATSTDFVGIGTTTPRAKLDVIGDIYGSANLWVGYGGDAILYTRHINGKGSMNNNPDTLYLNWGQDGYGVQIGDTANNHPLVVFGSGTFGTNAVINGGGSSYFNGGNVGIGTTAPGAKLAIYSSDDKDAGPIINLAGNATNQTESGRIRLTESAMNASSYYQGGFMHYNGLTNTLNIGVHNSADAATASDINAITILRASGNIGIGTTTPGRTFVVAGDMRATGILYDSNNSAGTSGNFLMSTASGYQWTSTSTLFGGSQVTGSGASNYVARWTGTNTLGTGVLYDTGTNVGIGTSSPIATLSVMGTSTAPTLPVFNIASSSGTSLFQVTAGAQILACATCRLTIPQGTNPTLSAAGDIAQDTTADQLLYGSQPNVLQATSTKSITWESPTASDNITFWRTDVPITITKASCIQTSSVNNPSTTVNIRHFTDRSTTTGNTLLASNTACTATTTTQSLTTDGDTTIAAGEWVWVITSATSNSSSTNITLEFKYDRQ